MTQPHTDPKKTIVFTIEIKNRELIPKCLLAYFFAQAGFRVYIGTFRSVNELRHRFKNVVFLHKSGYGRRAPGFKRSMTEHFCVLDEEMGAALIPSRLREIFEIRYSDFSSPTYDSVLTLNETHKEVLSRMPNMKGIDIQATGWPRVDLWRPDFIPIYETRVSALKEALGDFTLFVSSFGATSSKVYSKLRRSTTSQIERDYLDATEAAFTAYIELLRYLDKRITHCIVVRPHNGESSKDWEDILCGCNNIRVISDGDVTPWVLAAKRVLTYRSTVALQAALAGVPVVQFQVSDLDGKGEVPVYLVSECLNERDAVFATLERPVAPEERELTRTRARAVLQEHLGEPSGPLACERIVSYFHTVPCSKSPPIQPTALERSVFKAWHLIKYLEHLALKPFRRLLSRHFPPYRLDRFEKVPGGIQATEVQALLEKISIGHCRNNAATLACYNVSNNLVCLESTKPSQ